MQNWCYKYFLPHWESISLKSFHGMMKTESRILTLSKSMFALLCLIEMQMKIEIQIGKP